ncbi:MAG: 2-amino-4-hydroxy-6-hydroxymethyldihydropteridine diphosphokinase [Ginsengibacter sp.]
MKTLLPEETQSHAEKKEINIVYIITGGNIGNKKKNLENAGDQIHNRIGTIIQQSGIYETAAWGITEQPSFYNQVLKVKTQLFPEEIMKIILEIERDMGRIRTIKNASRNIDIDILFFNNDIINAKNVTIPHKEIPYRRFVLTPLNELAPELVHPILNKSLHELLINCKDELEVKKL